MSRIGSMPISIPSGVECVIQDGKVRVRGPKGSLEMSVFRDFEVAVQGQEIHVKPKNDVHPLETQISAFYGTLSRLIRNMVIGVSAGFEEKLELVGVGYKAELQGKVLKLALGYSHDILYPIPEGIIISVEKPTLFTISGADKQLVGQTRAEIQRFRKPEPYKGKGVRRPGQFILMKEGKAR
jgi:large subunit ribosomal protein L6